MTKKLCSWLRKPLRRPGRGFRSPCHGTTTSVSLQGPRRAQDNEQSDLPRPHHSVRQQLTGTEPPRDYGATGVGVELGYTVSYLLLIAPWISRADAPRECICIASRATSMQSVQVMPWVSHDATAPVGARDPTKQSTFDTWPSFSHPQ